MKTVLEILKLSTAYLTDHQVQNPRREAEELLAYALHLSRLDLYLQFDRPLMETELAVCRGYLQRRGKGEPFQYIKGEVSFLECSISLNHAVLIPRHETELLADKIAQALSKEELDGKTLLDLCCGSGCLGIALKKRFPILNVILSDISPSALAVARLNAERNEVDLSFLEGDLLAPFKNRRAHFIVCNPPYVSEEEFPSLDREVRQFEPKIALVGGRTGFEFYERLAIALPDALVPHGKVWMEVGATQGERLRQIFNHSSWKNSEIQKDLSGNDRFFLLEIE